MYPDLFTSYNFVHLKLYICTYVLYVYAVQFTYTKQFYLITECTVHQTIFYSLKHDEDMYVHGDNLQQKQNSKCVTIFH
jgi:hypothetical protein